MLTAKNTGLCARANISKFCDGGPYECHYNTYQREKNVLTSARTDNRQGNLDSRDEVVFVVCRCGERQVVAGRLDVKRVCI